MKCELCSDEAYSGDILCRLCSIRFEEKRPSFEIDPDTERNVIAAKRFLDQYGPIDLRTDRMYAPKNEEVTMK